MNAIGLRELRQNASEVIRRVEAGEEITVTVAGRPSARLAPIRLSGQWRTWSEISDLFAGPSDPSWEADRNQIDQAVGDPWT